MGDFCRGVDLNLQPNSVKLGIENHRFVDRYTDQHVEVKRLKGLISPQRRRFAGIMIDMVFDHFLIMHWTRFSNVCFHQSCANYYVDLEKGKHLMPERMLRVTSRVIEHDWFASYAELEGIGFALDRIAERIRFEHEFAGSVSELMMHKREIEEGFLHFFPELIKAVSMREIEKSPVTLG